MNAVASPPWWRSGWRYSYPAWSPGRRAAPFILGAGEQRRGDQHQPVDEQFRQCAPACTQNGSGTAIRGSTGGGAGIAGFFTSGSGSGVSGVVANQNSFGVYAGNDSATEGTGAAIRASGQQNEGVIATSADTNAVRGLVTGCDGLLCGGNGVAGDGLRLRRRRLRRRCGHPCRCLGPGGPYWLRSTRHNRPRISPPCSPTARPERGVVGMGESGAAISRDHTGRRPVLRPQRRLRRRPMSVSGRVSWRGPTGLSTGRFAPTGSRSSTATSTSPARAPDARRQRWPSMAPDPR